MVQSWPWDSQIVDKNIISQIRGLKVDESHSNLLLYYNNFLNVLWLLLLGEFSDEPNVL